MDMSGKPVGYAFAAIALVLIALAIHLYRSDAAFASRGAVAMGTVIGFRESTAQRRGPQASGNTPQKVEHYDEPIIRFRTPDERSHEFVALAGSFSEDLDKGDEVEVVYLPSEPWVAEIKGSTRLSDGFIAVSILAGSSLVPALFLVVLPALQQRRRSAKLLSSPQRMRRIEADVVEVRRLKRAAAGTRTFAVAAQWRDPSTGKLHRFESGTMAFDPAVYAQIRKLADWGDPSDQMVRQALGGARLLVRVHPDDPSHYDAGLLRIPGIGPAEA